jgi:hypothetical protein
MDGMSSATMDTTQSHVHHYVPRWYQKRFLKPGQFQFCYLDLHPETVINKGKKYQRRALLRWGPDRCFYQNDLYTLNLGNLSRDDVERFFFGRLDNRGRHAVEFFGEYAGLSKCVSRGDVPELFQILPQYMDAQRFRTPKGLDYLQ